MIIYRKGNSGNVPLKGSFFCFGFKRQGLCNLRSKTVVVVGRVMKLNSKKKRRELIKKREKTGKRKTRELVVGRTLYKR